VKVNAFPHPHGLRGHETQAILDHVADSISFEVLHLLVSFLDLASSYTFSAGFSGHKGCWRWYTSMSAKLANMKLPSILETSTITYWIGQLWETRRFWIVYVDCTWFVTSLNNAIKTITPTGTSRISAAFQIGQSAELCSVSHV